MTNYYPILGISYEGQKILLPYMHPTNVKVLFVLHKDSFAYRAAEYGIDPNDSHTLLDVLLHERSWNIDTSHPKFVYNTDEASARDFMLSEIDKVKKQHLFVDSDNHLHDIHINHKPNMILHGHHKKVVADLRKKKRAISI